MNLLNEVDQTKKNGEYRERSQMLAKEYLLAVVQKEGYQVESPVDAWGTLVGVQTKIALDAANGSKATTAAKFVAQATGMILGGNSDPGELNIDDFDELGGEAALEILQVVLAEQKKRAMEGEPQR